MEAEPAREAGIAKIKEFGDELLKLRTEIRNVKDEKGLDVLLERIKELALRVPGIEADLSKFASTINKTQVDLGKVRPPGLDKPAPGMPDISVKDIVQTLHTEVMSLAGTVEQYRETLKKGALLEKETVDSMKTVPAEIRGIFTGIVKGSLDAKTAMQVDFKEIDKTVEGTINWVDNLNKKLHEDLTKPVKIQIDTAEAMDQLQKLKAIGGIPLDQPIEPGTIIKPPETTPETGKIAGYAIPDEWLKLAQQQSEITKTEVADDFTQIVDSVRIGTGLINNSLSTIQPPDLETDTAWQNDIINAGTNVQNNLTTNFQNINNAIIGTNNILNQFKAQLENFAINVPVKFQMPETIPPRNVPAGDAQWNAPAFATGGLTPRGKDRLLAWVSEGEFIMNPDATKAFYSQLVAMNSAVRPGYYANGGYVSTNVGDIHLNVTNTGNAERDVRTIGKLLRREIKRGTVRLY
jgi:hypothetical protein